ncbi:MAG TPA: c-type cytochrome biogenesis protein CcmI [Brevundimonas sp.]|nr:c-type cytochrome biogenesis protein CcmI [Brevundimonas sp.]
MTVFWIMTGLMAALAGLLVLSGARRGVGSAGAVEETVGVQSARTELDELDRLKARGLLDEAGWTAARAEAGRRLLASDRQTVVVEARPSDRLWVLGGLAFTAVAALGLYAVFGASGSPDQPYERRVDEWAARPETLEAPQLAAVAARVVRERPEDHQALTMLGAARFEAGDPIGAASAFRRALAIRPEDAQSWARLGESLVRANEGAVGGDAEAAFAQALRRDPAQLGARYFLGEAALGRGDAAMLRAMWEPLIAALAPSDPRRADLERRMTAMEGGA